MNRNDPVDDNYCPARSALVGQVPAPFSSKALSYNGNK